MKRLSLAACLVVALAACDRGGGTSLNFKHNRDGQGTKVATFGEDSITAEELTKRFGEMSPYARARYQAVEQRKEFVEGMARFELLAAEAVKRGLANDPEVLHTTKQVMIQKLLKQEYEEKPNPVTDAEVAAYYEKRKADYVKPEMVRLVHVFLAAKEGEPAREEKKKQAQALLEKAKTLTPLDFTAFGALARESSEEPRTKPLDGDMRFLSHEELAKQFGEPVAVAAKELKTVGEVFPSVVETPAGLHVLKLQGRTDALNLKVEDVKTQIQGYIIFEKRNQNFANLLEKLKKESSFKVDDAALAKVEVDLKAPTKESKGPPVGFIPPPVLNGAPALPSGHANAGGR